jgi:hypothetical protein
MSLKDEIKKQISEARKTVSLIYDKKERPSVAARIFAPIRKWRDEFSAAFSSSEEEVRSNGRLRESCLGSDSMGSSPDAVARIFAPIKEALDVLSTEFSYNSRLTFNTSLTELLNDLEKHDRSRSAKVGYCRSYKAPNRCLYYIKSQSLSNLFVFSIGCCNRYFWMHVDEYSDIVSGQIFTSDYMEGGKSKWLRHLTGMLVETEEVQPYYEKNGVLVRRVK